MNTKFHPRFVIGCLLLLIVVLFLLVPRPARAQPPRVHGPPGSGGFGGSVTVLPNGNLVVPDPDFTGPGNLAGAGAVHLYDSATLRLISTLTGGRAGDRVGSGGVTVLPGGDYLISSPEWGRGRGAVTWGSGAAGVSGRLSPDNSLTGSQEGDGVGGSREWPDSPGIHILKSGHYLISSPGWGAGCGAVTWGSGTAGVRGEISAANSLVGTRPGDRVGRAAAGSSAFGLMVLDSGHYLVSSPDWNGGRGAVTWGSGSAGVRGEVSAVNSLTGTAGGAGEAADRVGGGWVRPLDHGNYVVGSPDWNGGRGAVTWGSGSAGVRGEVSAVNSLTGAFPGDGAGSSRPVRLGNGNYLVTTPGWNGGRGAVTWGSGAAGVTGEISAANSLVVPAGRRVDVYSLRPQVLANGHYVVYAASPVESPTGPEWGAVTWGGGGEGVRGEISAANSLVSDSEGRPGLCLLAGGDYVVAFPDWNGGRGAVAWASGMEGARGEISTARPLTGAAAGDRVGWALHPLARGGYAVRSPYWSQGRGAVTWGGARGVAGEVSAANSLVGTLEGDDPVIFGPVITPLKNGDFLVVNPYWSRNRGAVTWCAGDSPAVGEISAANSLTGVAEGDGAGSGGVVELGNGNYVVNSPGGSGRQGAVTWCRGGGPVAGEISAANSLTGTYPGDDFRWGQRSPVMTLGNGNYLVISPGWGDGQGAVTWGSGTEGVRGAVSEGNSLTGVMGRIRFIPHTGDGFPVITLLDQGDYVIGSPYWSQNRGAVTWCSGRSGRTGAVSAANSLTGVQPGDSVGLFPVIRLGNGNHALRNPRWNGARGAVTWFAGGKGPEGEISPANSLTGGREGDFVGGGGITLLSGGNYVVSSPQWDGGRGAVTWCGGDAPVTGGVSAANSLTGTDPGDAVGRPPENGGYPEGVMALANGNYVVWSAEWNRHAGAVTWGSGAEGVRGEVSAANSLVGTPARPLGRSLFAQPDGDYLITSRYPETEFPTVRGVTVLGDGAAGTRGYLTDFNSFTGTVPARTASLVNLLDAPRRRMIVGYGAENVITLLPLEPGIAVTGGRGADVLDGSLPAWERGTDFGTVTAGGAGVARVFTVLETGARRLVLTGNPQVEVTGPHAGDFTVIRQPSLLHPESASPTFGIAFHPSGAGPRAAVVRIANNTADRNPFTFPLVGQGVDPARGAFAVWRDGWAGQAVEGTAPEEDFDRDGVSNLLEFAFGTDPAAAGSGPAPLEITGPLTPGGGAVLVSAGGPVIRVEDGVPHAVWIRRRDSLTGGLKAVPWFSADLAHWEPAADIPSVLAGSGDGDGDSVMEAVTVPFPEALGPGGTGGKARFFRLSVTLEP